jgi:hypothetical protein
VERRGLFTQSRNDENDHLRLAFGREGGGKDVETPEITTSGSCFDASEVVVVVGGMLKC